MSEYLVTKVEKRSVNLEQAMSQEPTEVKGVIQAMGIDGFLTRELEKANWFREIEDTLTGEQLDIIKDFKENS